jgi:hypothetical protein
VLAVLRAAAAVLGAALLRRTATVRVSAWVERRKKALPL